jgi:hypothetical protein
MPIQSILLTALVLWVYSVIMLAGVCAIVTWFKRRGFAYPRPFGVSDAESLMNLSPMGSLHCICEPDDPTAPQNERRRSCRACGHAIVAGDPTRLYEDLSRRQIEQIISDLRRAAINHRHAPSPDAVPRPNPTLARR